MIYDSQVNFHISANLYIPPEVPSAVSRGALSDGPYAQRQGRGRLSTLLSSARAAWVSGPGVRSDGTRRARLLSGGPGTTRSRLGPDAEHTKPGRQMLLTGIHGPPSDLGRDSQFGLSSSSPVGRSPTACFHRPVRWWHADHAVCGCGWSSGGCCDFLGNTENVACAHFKSPGSTDDAEQDLIGAASVGFDRWDLFYPLAPKPLQIQVSSRDFFGTYSPVISTMGLESTRSCGRCTRCSAKRTGLAGSPFYSAAAWPDV